MAKKKTSSRWLAWLMLAVAAFAGFQLWQRYRGFADTPIVAAEGQRVLSIVPGDGFDAILAKMRALGIRNGHALEWKALAAEMDVQSRLQVGDYDLSAAITPRELLHKLATGDVIQYRFTIIEGWNFRDLRAALGRNPDLEHKLAAMSDAEVMAALDRKGRHPEGRFLPETYQFNRGSSDVDLLRRAMRAMDDALSVAWEQHDHDAPLKSPDELLTLASIVEKETGNADERPQIAGVFARRLKLGMRLQTDPTVIYGMGSVYAGNIRKKDLETDTPYNTYTRAGLPPTPIAMPGVAALQAAARPTPGDALYFVARGDGSGRHVFAATLAEHNANVVKYQLKR